MKQHVSALACCAGVMAVTLMAAEAVGQSYPAKSIRLIVPFSAGGPTDSIARIIAQRLSERLGQQVVVDNRAGANAIIGTELGVKSPPDGYTLVMVAFPHAINPSLYPKLPYDTQKDLVPVSLATAGPMLMAVHPSVPVTNLKGLMALAKARPGELTCGSSGNGSTAHLALEMLNFLGGTKITHVAYKGAAQGMSDLLGGHLSMYFGGIPPLLPHVKNGKLKGLAVSTKARSAAAPDIPTVAELGLPAYEVSGWYGIVAPARTPKEIVARLNSEIVSLLKVQDTQQRMAANGAEIVASTPEEFGAYVATEIAKWEKVIRSAGIRAD
jgi:tripartite-type tricarboxylate transporter receptor subunit TctC